MVCQYQRLVVLVMIASATVMLCARKSGADESWPVYRGDKTRCGYTAQDLTPPLHLQWTHVSRHRPRPAWPEPGKEVHRMTFDHAYQVVAADGRMYYGSSADHKVYAVDLDSGRELWSFYTEGPVRFSPCVSNGRVYAASDDGCLYCLNSRDGGVIWRFRGGPRDERMFGNGQMISRWPGRSGVLVDGQTAYFTTGMWGPDGVSIYALDTDDGSVIWNNNTSNQQYMLMPHNNFEGITGISPQGYLALADGVLLVPTGRAMPARFDTATGRLLPWKIAWGKHHRPGSAWTMTTKGVFFSACRRGTGLPVSSLGPDSVLRPEGLMAWSVGTGDPVFSLADVYRAAFSDETLYLTAGTYSGKPSSVLAVDYEKISKEVNLSPPHADGHDGAGFAAQRVTDKAKWQTPTDRIYELIVAGEVLVAGGPDSVMLLDADSGDELWKAKVEGQARGLAVISGRLLVSTTTGRIYCFGKEKVAEGRTVEVPAGERDTSPQAEPAKEIIERCGIRAGYCLVLGLDAPDLAAGLVAESDLSVIVFEQDEGKIARARRLYDRLELYGVRIAVHQGDPKRLPYAPYFANLIVVPDPSSCDPASVYRFLRPCGGVLAMLGADAVNTLPAGGIVLMPEASSSCTCAYSFQTSLALIADDRHEHWGAYTCEPPKRGSQLKTVSFNFGGVGDKRDEKGKLWLGFPRPFSPQNLRVPLSTCKAADYYRENADEIAIEGTEQPWLYSCGVTGLASATLELDMARPAVALNVEEAPRIDGRLDDACWDGAEELRLVDDSRRVSSARAWLRHDAENLYIGFVRKAPLTDGAPMSWTMNTQGENAPAWRDDSLKVRFQKGVNQYEYIFLSASGARVTGKSDLRWIMRGTEKELDWKTATHVTDTDWSAEIAVPFDGPAEGQEIFLESFNRTGVGPERTFYKFRSWRRWFVSGGEADLVFERRATPSERTFTVRLHFAELKDVRPGERVFDVKIQDRTVIEDLDVASEAGGCRKALTREIKGIRAVDTISMGLVPSADSKRPAILSAVEIEQED